MSDMSRALLCSHHRHSHVATFVVVVVAIDSVGHG